MQEKRPNTIVVIALLILTAVTAFAAGFEASILAQGRRRAAYAPLPPLPSPTPATPVPLPSIPPTPTRPEEETFQIFWEAWGIIQENYYGDLPDMRTVTYGAIRGMLATLGDEYTSFIEPDIAAILNEDASGTFQGIGAFVRMRGDGKLEIVGVFEGSPAEAAGLQEGDLVIAVNGESIVGYSLYEAITLIRGPAGTEVTLTIERPKQGETFDVTVTRARLEIPMVQSEMLDGGIGYIRLHEFGATATEQLEETLRRVLAEQPRGLILDLRDDPGGWLSQAVQVADLFLGDGIILIQRSYEGEEVFRSYDGDLAEDIPLVVLVNGGTASASEIVAGAIQARGRGILIGERTLGKGSVQRPYRLSDGSELRVTIARWYTPNDVAIHGQGLIPDIEVPMPEEGESGGEDPQLERAIEYLLTGE
ncbi:MAG TPA: S41 family peptidase [Thermoflexia bacterium]|nr:S41 family peptidase [Thermoflexia bacterium]